MLCSSIFWSAKWQVDRRNYTLALSLIILGGLLLRIFVASDPFLHEWDERYHALVAKNLMSFPFKPMLYENPVLPYDYRHWAGNHIWVHKQPLPLWCMAISLKCFGINEFALRLPSILLSTLAIYLTYRIGLYFLNHKLALLAAFLHAIHGLSIELTGGRVATDHFDLFFMFFIELSVFLSIIQVKENYQPLISSLIGIALGAAILTKWLPALIVLPVWVLLRLHESVALKKILQHLMIIIGWAIIVAVPWQLYIFSKFPQEASWEYDFNVKHLTTALDGHGQPWYYHLDRLRIIFGELIYLPLLWLVLKSWRLYQKRNFKLLALLLWIWIPILFFSIAKTKMQAYTIFIAPAMFILTAFFWYYLNFYREKIFRNSNYLGWLVASLFIVLPIRYAFERVKPFQQIERGPSWVQLLKSLDSKIDTSNAILFNTTRPIESMFYTELVAAYPQIPERAIIIELLGQGYDLYILKKDRILPLSIENLNQ